MAKTPGDYERPKDEDATDRMLMTPGILYPLVVPQPGSEGARAVCEYRTFVEGRILPDADYDADGALDHKKFRADYEDDYMINDSAQIEDWHEESGEHADHSPHVHNRDGQLGRDKRTDKRTDSSVKRLGKYGPAR